VLKHRIVSLLATVAPRSLPLRHLGRYHYSDKFLIGDDDDYAGVDYAAVYERYLRSWRRRRFTLLELGVYRGQSLRAWRAYFPKARIVGLDIDPDAAQRAGDFTVYVGSQADPDLLSQVKRDLSSLDVVIDDASHLNELTVASFRQLFPQVSSGGLYFIEDVPKGSGDVSDVPLLPGMKYNVGVAKVNRREVIDDLLVELAQDAELGSQRTVDFVHVWPRIVVVGRA
jgi:hypothetical protein